MTTPIEETSTETVTEKVVETPVVKTPVTETVTPAGENDDELPEWARTKLTKANSEAANYRTRLRETEAKLLEAKTPEEFAAGHIPGAVNIPVQELDRRIRELEPNHEECGAGAFNHGERRCGQAQPACRTR